MSTSAESPSGNAPSTPRKSRPLLRVVTSAILAGVVLYLVWLRGPFHSKPKPSSQPLRTLSPSAEGAAAFAWLPRFPGAVTEDITNSVNHERVSRSFHFRVPPAASASGDSSSTARSATAPPETGQSPDGGAVRTYYETQLRAAGFTVVVKSDGVLHAESPDGKRILEMTVAASQAGVEGNVAAVEK